MTHHPQGARCAACTHRLDDCSHLPFSTMPVHRHDGVDVVVICTAFVPAKGERGKPFINPRRGRRL